MTTDITELAQSLKAAAEKATPGPWQRSSVRFNGITDIANPMEQGNKPHVANASEKRDAEFIAMANPANILELVEAVEKAQGMETYWKTQCRGITDHCEELQARIAELESHTVKPPVHPTVASEKLDDETLQELIEFRRTTFEYHSKEGNKVQTIIHGVTLAALRELQERRKADSEPVAEVVSIYGYPEAFGEREIRPLVGIQQMPYGTKLYRHAQPAVDSEFIPKNLDKALGVLGMAIPESREEFNFQTERWIQRLIDRVIRYADEFQDQPASVVPQDVLEALQKVARIRLDLNDFDGDRRGIADCLGDAEEALIEVVNRRAAMLHAGNSPAQSDCCPAQNHFYPAQNQGWIPVSERIPDNTEPVLCIEKRADFGTYRQPFVCWHDGGGWVGKTNYRPIVTHWMPLPAAPQEVKGE